MVGHVPCRACNPWPSRAYIVFLPTRILSSTLILLSLFLIRPRCFVSFVCSMELAPILSSNFVAFLVSGTRSVFVGFILTRSLSVKISAISSRAWASCLEQAIPLISQCHLRMLVTPLSGFRFELPFLNRYLAINIEGQIGQPTIIKTSSFNIPCIPPTNRGHLNFVVDTVS